MNNEKFCSGHTNLVQAIGRLEGKVDIGFKSIHNNQLRVEQRLNGAFKIMGKHIGESDKWRGKIIKLETGKTHNSRIVDVSLRIMKLAFYVVISICIIYLMAQGTR